MRCEATLRLSHGFVRGANFETTCGLRRDHAGPQQRTDKRNTCCFVQTIVQCCL